MKTTEKMLMDLFAGAQPRSLQKTLLDPSTPTSIRFQILHQILGSGDEEGLKVVARLLDAAAAGDSKDAYVEKTKELARLMEQMQAGQLRMGTFDSLEEDARLGRRAQVVLPDGGLAFAVVADDALAKELQCGDTVWMDAQLQTVLYRRAERPRVGEEGRVERRLSKSEVEVSIGELGRYVFRTARPLRDQLDGGEAKPGSTVIVCPRRMFAFYALPESDELGHLKFLTDEPVPDVVAERDLGAPPAYIEELGQHVRRELSDPALSRRYGLRRSLFNLLTGPPGTGKSASIEAAWNRMYLEMSAVTGVPVDQLPRRVLHLRPWQVNSKWFGSTDRNLAQFFDEIEKLAAEPWIAPDGTVWYLPVLVVWEEIEAHGRTRGEDSIHDRILSTLLQRLDPSRRVFRDRCVCFLATTNMPELVDRAVLRRIGGSITRFGGTDRRVFRAVLEKQLKDRPFHVEADGNGASEDAARARAIDDLTAWLFSPNAGDPALVELTYAGQTTRVKKHRRDFLTPALVDRAVQEASLEACRAEWRGGGPAGLTRGLTSELLMAELDRQVRSVVALLRPGNCASYLALPDGVRVSGTNRLEQPAVTPLELERVS